MIKDLPGCMSVGETLSEAMENIQEARELWIETAYRRISQRSRTGFPQTRRYQ